MDTRWAVNEHRLLCWLAARYGLKLPEPFNDIEMELTACAPLDDTTIWITSPWVPMTAWGANALPAPERALVRFVARVGEASVALPPRLTVKLRAAGIIWPSKYESLTQWLRAIDGSPMVGMEEMVSLLVNTRAILRYLTDKYQLPYPPGKGRLQFKQMCATPKLIEIWRGSSPDTVEWDLMSLPLEVRQLVFAAIGAHGLVRKGAAVFPNSTPATLAAELCQAGVAGRAMHMYRRKSLLGQ